MSPLLRRRMSPASVNMNVSSMPPYRGWASRFPYEMQSRKKLSTMRTENVRKRAYFRYPCTCDKMGCNPIATRHAQRCKATAIANLDVWFLISYRSACCPTTFHELCPPLRMWLHGKITPMRHYPLVLMSIAESDPSRDHSSELTR